MNLTEILNKLEKARLITINGEKYELSHDTLARKIDEKRSGEEKALIEWELLIRNKMRAGKQSGTPDYLTSGQINGIAPFEKKLFLNTEEKDFLEKSKINAKAVETREKRRRMNIIYGVSTFAVIALGLAIFGFVSKSEADKANKEVTKQLNIVKTEKEKTEVILNQLEVESAKRKEAEISRLLDVSKNFIALDYPAIALKYIKAAQEIDRDNPNVQKMLKELQR